MERKANWAEHKNDAKHARYAAQHVRERTKKTHEKHGKYGAKNNRGVDIHTVVGRRLLRGGDVDAAR